MTWKDRKIAAGEMMRHNPCRQYTQARVEELLGEGLTPLEICDLEIPAEDRIWSLTRKGVLPDRVNRLFACWCAREAIKMCDDPDLALAKSVDIAERFANGEATDEELSDAHAAAEEAAVARAREREQAEEAAWAAAWTAAGRAAREAARRGQIEKLREMIEAEPDSRSSAPEKLTATMAENLREWQKRGEVTYEVENVELACKGRVVQIGTIVMPWGDIGIIVGQDSCYYGTDAERAASAYETAMKEIMR